MIRDTIVIEKKKICDFCGEDETVGCEVCGNDLCDKCYVRINMNKYSDLIVCPECAKLDYSEYKAIYQKIEQLSTTVDKMYDEASEILDKMNPYKEEV